MKRAISYFSIAVLLAAIAVLRYSTHPIPWLLGLTISIPIFAAIAGAVFRHARR